MIWDIVEQVHLGEKDTLINAINCEVSRGVIKPVDNAAEVVELLLDALHGVRVSAKSHKKTMFPGMEQLEDIRKKRLFVVAKYLLKA